MSSKAVFTIAESLGSRQEFLDEIEKQRRDIDYGLSLLKEAKAREGAADEKPDSANWNS